MLPNEQVKRTNKNQQEPSTTSVTERTNMTELSKPAAVCHVGAKQDSDSDVKSIVIEIDCDKTAESGTVANQMYLT